MTGIFLYGHCAGKAQGIILHYLYQSTVSRIESRFHDIEAWNLGFSYYMREFFGLVAESSINGENKNIIDLSAEIRWAFYKRRGWIVNTRSVDMIGYFEDMPEQGSDNGAYWRTENSIEFNFRKGHNGGMFFITYTLDKMPQFQGIERFSRDQLLQFGVRFFM